MLVVDASVLVNALADDGLDGDRARTRLLADRELHVPDMIDLEVLSVLRKHLRRGSLDDRRAGLALNDLQALAVTRYPALPFLDEVWRLRDNLTPYDGAYVALALALDCPLLSADERLAAAPGLPCAVELLA